MKVQVVLVVCFVVFLQKCYGVAIQPESTDIKESPILAPSEANTNTTFIPQILSKNPNIDLTTANAITEPTTRAFVPHTSSVTTTVRPEITCTTPPTKTILEKDSNTTFTYPTEDKKISKDLNDPKVDARDIHNALTGSIADVNVIIKVLARKTRTQRLKVGEQYKLLFKTELTEDLKLKLSDWFQKLVLDLLAPLTEYYVKELYEAMDGAGTDEDALIEILCTTNNYGIRQINMVYEKTYKATLESHIKYDTSGYFEDLLVALIKADRDESEKVDKAQAVADPKALYDAGEGRLGTDESTFITILTQRNHKHLKQIFNEYQTLTEHSLEYAIECEFSTSIQRGLLAIVKAIRDLPDFYAERLHSSIEGSSINHKHLIRIVTTRNEVDMDLIKRRYKTNYGITIEEAIAASTSGEYKTLLLELVQENPCQYKNLLGCSFITVRNDDKLNS